MSNKTEIRTQASHMKKKQQQNQTNQANPLHTYKRKPKAHKTLDQPTRKKPLESKSELLQLSHYDFR